MITVKQLKDHLENFNDNANVIVELVPYSKENIIGEISVTDNIFPDKDGNIVIHAFDF